MSLVVAGGMILIALFLLRSEWEKLQLRTVRTEIRTGKTVRGTEDLPDGEKRLRLLFISDLHEYLPAVHTPEKIMEAIENEAPDAVLIGGDMITVHRQSPDACPDVSVALALVRRIVKKYPVYYGEGNHESRLRDRNPEKYAEYVSGLLESGVCYLADTTVPLKLRHQSGKDGEYVFADSGAEISSVSLEEYYYRRSPGFGLKDRLPEGYLKKRMTGKDQGRFQILLLHHPGFLKEAAEAGMDLVLSGHMHGGTVRFPGGTGLMGPQYRFFVKECSGVFKEGNTAMIVNRGLGTHSIKLRFNDLPEMSVIDIKTSNTETV